MKLPIAKVVPQKISTNARILNYEKNWILIGLNCFWVLVCDSDFFHMDFLSPLKVYVNERANKIRNWSQLQAKNRIGSQCGLQ